MTSTTTSSSTRLAEARTEQLTAVIAGTAAAVAEDATRAAVQFTVTGASTGAVAPRGRRVGPPHRGHTLSATRRCGCIAPMTHTGPASTSPRPACVPLRRRMP